jgi:hypothetical protein
MTTIEMILKEEGPLMSGKLSERLSEKNKIALNTASQKVSRSKKINKIKGFFTSNQSFCYLLEHVEGNGLYEIFSEYLFENGKKYWYCLNAIQMHGGVIESKFLECYTNYPVEALKRHIPFRKVMQMFVNEGILLFDKNKYLFSPKFNRVNVNLLFHHTIETIKENVLSDFVKKTKNMGMISYNSGKIFAEYGKFRWGFQGVSYLRGLVANKQPGFVLADILLGNMVYEKDVLFFIEKLNHIQSFKNASRIIPFLIVDDLHSEALKILKKNGIVVGFIKDLFGEQYALALKELVTILNNAVASLKADPDKYLELIKQLKIYNQTLLYNIRGALFEYFVGHIHSKNSQSLEIGREIFENNNKHEIDILAIYSDRVVFAECKATNSKIDIDYIDSWIGKKIPAFRKWLLKQEMLKNHKIEFEYWATGGFTEEAESKLKLLSESARKYKSKYFTPVSMRKLTIDNGDKKMKESLDTFFLKPMV